jgi:hypothetical protein
VISIPAPPHWLATATCVWPTRGALGGVERPVEARPLHQPALNTRWDELRLQNRKLVLAASEDASATSPNPCPRHALHPPGLPERSMGVPVWWQPPWIVATTLSTTVEKLNTLRRGEI